MFHHNTIDTVYSSVVYTGGEINDQLFCHVEMGRDLLPKKGLYGIALYFYEKDGKALFDVRIKFDSDGADPTHLAETFTCYAIEYSVPVYGSGRNIRRGIFDLVPKDCWDAFPIWNSRIENIYFAYQTSSTPYSLYGKRGLYVHIPKAAKTFDDSTYLVGGNYENEKDMDCEWFNENDPNFLSFQPPLPGSYEAKVDGILFSLNVTESMSCPISPFVAIGCGIEVMVSRSQRDLPMMRYTFTVSKEEIMTHKSQPEYFLTLSNPEVFPPDEDYTLLYSEVHGLYLYEDNFIGHDFNFFEFNGN